MRTPALLLVAVMATSGCFGFLGHGLDDHRVARTPIDEDGWNTDGVFSVQVREADPVEVRIEGTASDGRTLHADGPSSDTLPAVDVVVPDGTWTIKYYLDGQRWETFRDVRFDATAPALTGLATIGDARGGSYTIGQGVSVEAGAGVQVIDQSTGAVIATALPVTVSGLADGIHAYDVVVTDPAGNEANEQVQVRVGAATQLPAGRYTLGLVARYTVTADIWDISGLSSWPSPAAARTATGGAWLGSGRGIAPDDAAVKSVVASTVTSTMTTGEAALALYRYMADHLEYDRSRLEANTLLTPRQVLLDAEDPRDDTAAGDGDGTGLARDGAGNGVSGGVCRDLAATYVSLLRASGIPARLVTGYLGGEVDGFHAWVEFYGGEGHGPSAWVPVDVSSVGSSSEPGEQGYETQVALQAFGIRHTDMLPLRVVSASGEQAAWSAAVALSTSYPEGQKPQVTLGKELTVQFETKGTLCVDVDHLARETIGASSAQDCPHQYTHGIAGFVRSASHVLDYGAQVGSAARGTTVTLTLAAPDPAAVAPGSVEQATYGRAFSQPDAEGKRTATWSA